LHRPRSSVHSPVIPSATCVMQPNVSLAAYSILGRSATEVA
jgi:hypothetical protein